MYVLMWYFFGRYFVSSGRFLVYWLCGMWLEGVDIMFYLGFVKFSLLLDGLLCEMQRGCWVLCIMVFWGVVVCVDNICYFVMRKVVLQCFYVFSDQFWLFMFFLL